MVKCFGVCAVSDGGGRGAGEGDRGGVGDVETCGWLEAMVVDGRWGRERRRGFVVRGGHGGGGHAQQRHVSVIGSAGMGSALAWRRGGVRGRGILDRLRWDSGCGILSFCLFYVLGSGK